MVATGFAVVVGRWAASLVHARASGLGEIVLRVAIGAVFFAALAVVWHQFGKMESGVE